MMREFLFHATLLASIRVKAETQAEAELKLREALRADSDQSVSYPQALK